MKNNDPIGPDYSSNSKPVVFVSAFAVDAIGPAWPGSSGRPQPHGLFTLFHGFVVVGICVGLALGMDGGARLFGVAGGIAGALAGGCAGFIVGRIPELLVLRSLSDCLASKTSEELRSYLHNANCLTPNIVLLELQRRGEDVSQELGVILDLLVSEDFARRGRGWAALTSAFPHLVREMCDYRVGDSVTECRRKTEKLRSEELITHEAM